ncbi:type II toxin-antitoxin system RelE/ParE family toxin [Thermoleptolyngbya sp.]
MRRAIALWRLLIKDASSLLVIHNIGKSYAHLRPGLRGLGLMRYVIFYRVINDNIEILRVISGYRNLQEILSE